MFDLKGRVAIVTGASGAIGGAIAEGFHDANAEVWATGRSLEKLRTLGLPRERLLVADLSNPEGRRKLFDEISGSGSVADVLVNCAGVTRESWEATIEVNLSAAHDMCLLFADRLATKGWAGSIINVTSIASDLGFPGNPQYVASKGGLKALTKALALDWGGRNIRVNNLCPGYIRTPMTEASYQDEELRSERLERTILGRWGTPTDLVGAAVFLASGASSYMTGADLVIDGGWSAKGL
ncbi:MAG: SDR family NAD(P)-dependent oxidoreductase [Planctomycetota bacterium]|jgi:NAD(P)-dependent dehydrogenase (short-subunit alcohol dehydrogenase family)